MWICLKIHRKNQKQVVKHFIFTTRLAILGYSLFFDNHNLSKTSTTMVVCPTKTNKNPSNNGGPILGLCEGYYPWNNKRPHGFGMVWQEIRFLSLFL
jgi:hypothetical protein